jgi:hypothetical protein
MTGCIIHILTPVSFENIHCTDMHVILRFWAYVHALSCLLPLRLYSHDPPYSISLAAISVK